MASINPYSPYSSASRGFSGLVSGMDTQSMVDKMLSGTKAKIDKQVALRQQTVWRQELYRDVISSMKNFQTSFFSFSGNGKNNLLSSGFYNSMSSTTTSTAVKVSGTAVAQTGKITIDKVTQLAQATKEKSSGPVTAELAGEINLNAFKKTVKINVDGNVSEITLSGSTNDDILSNLNASLSGTGLTASVNSTTGALTIDSGNTSSSVSIVGGSTIGLSMLGVSVGATSTDGKLTGKIDATKDKASLTFNLDGIQKTINLDTNATTASGLASSLQSSLTQAFGNGIKVTESGGKISFETVKSDGSADKSRQLTISGDNNSMSAIGMKSGQSSKINLNMSLADAGFKTELQGSAFRFTINGTTIEASASDSINTVINRINGSNAGVRVSYSSTTDEFFIESSMTGSGTTISMSQETGNLLSALFGTASSGNVVGNGLMDISQMVGSSAVSSTTTFAGGDFKFTVDGELVTINLPARTTTDASGNQVGNPYTRTEVVDAINAQLGNGTSGISLSVNSDDKIVINNPNGKEIKFETRSNLAASLGFNPGMSTENATTASSTTQLKDMGLTSGIIKIGSTEFDLSTYANKTGSELATDMTNALGGNGTVTFENGKFLVAGVSSQVTVSGVNADGNAAMEKMFGASEMVLKSSAPVGSTANGTTGVQQGQNAKFLLNGGTDVVERSSNSFSIDGVSIELLETTNDKIEINTTRNNTDTIDGLKKFVDEYNKMIDKLNGLMDAEPTYKKYAPLTAEQKKEMSESEIKLWEEKAKEGLIRKDDIISSILSDMRTIMYQKPAGAKYSLYDLGISTGGYKDKGKLVFDETSTALADALNRDPAEVERLFTDSIDGIATKIDNMISDATKVTSNSPYSLVKVAGSPGMPDSTSNIAKKLKDIDDVVTRLNRTYDMEKSRYWKQFNSMEQMLANMNQQSSWLASQFS